MIDFWRFYRIFILQITSRSFHLKKVKVLIVLGNSDQNHISLSINMCKFKGKSLMCQYMKNKPIKWALTFWFQCCSKSAYLYQFDMYLGKKSKTEFGLGESVVLSLCMNLKNSYCYVPNLMLKLFEDGIYTTGTVKSNRKHMLTLKVDKQMKRGEHD